MNGGSFTQQILDAAHRHSIRHREEVLASDVCGCFHCCAVFPPSEIARWIDEKGEAAATAWCPHCGIDSVIGSKSGYPISSDFLSEMKVRWFGIDNDED